MTEIWVRHKGMVEKGYDVCIKKMIKEKELEYGMMMGYWCELYGEYVAKK